MTNANSLPSVFLESSESNSKLVYYSQQLFFENIQITSNELQQQKQLVDNILDNLNEGSSPLTSGRPAQPKIGHVPEPESYLAVEGSLRIFYYQNQVTSTVTSMHDEISQVERASPKKEAKELDSSDCSVRNFDFNTRLASPPNQGMANPGNEDTPFIVGEETSGTNRKYKSKEDADEKPLESEEFFAKSQSSVFEAQILRSPHPNMTTESSFLKQDMQQEDDVTCSNVACTETTATCSDTFCGALNGNSADAFQTACEDRGECAKLNAIAGFSEPNKAVDSCGSADQTLLEQVKVSHEPLTLITDDLMIDSGFVNSTVDSKSDLIIISSSSNMMLEPIDTPPVTVDVSSSQNEIIEPSSIQHDSHSTETEEELVAKTEVVSESFYQVTDESVAQTTSYLHVETLEIPENLEFSLKKLDINDGREENFVNVEQIPDLQSAGKPEHKPSDPSKAPASGPSKPRSYCTLM